MDEWFRSDASLSVVMPCHNEGKGLQAQLSCVIPQLMPCDELVMVDDGSSDGTGAIMQRYLHVPGVRLYRTFSPSGANEAQNYAARLAEKEWVYMCSGGDTLCPGALAAFRAAARAWPHAEIIYGRIKHGPPALNVSLSWAPEARVVDRDGLRNQWMASGEHDTQAAQTFIRRRVWGAGYQAGQHLADWWHGWKIAAQYGCGWIPEVICELSAPGYSRRNDDDQARAEAMNEILVDALARRDLADQVLLFHLCTRFLDPVEPMVFFERE